LRFVILIPEGEQYDKMFVIVIP